MLKRTLVNALSAGAVVLGVSLAAAGTAFAGIGGCADSPENPTWILAGIGGIAAGVPWLHAKLKRRK